MILRLLKGRGVVLGLFEKKRDAIPPQALLINICILLVSVAFKGNFFPNLVMHKLSNLSFA
jgi:hypothetical protein